MENSDWRKFFQNKHKQKYLNELYPMIYSKLLDAINHNLSECVLFDSKLPPYLCVAKEEDYNEILERCMGIFIEMEEYEICSTIKDLIEQQPQPVDVKISAIVGSIKTKD